MAKVLCSKLGLLLFLSMLLGDCVVDLEASNHVYKRVQSSKTKSPPLNQPYRTGYHLKSPKNWMNGQTTASLSCKVNRRSSELISPAKPTPKELKVVSDIDDQDVVRTYLPLLFLYRGNKSNIVDPVHLIRNAIAVTLVSYYPFAGRLREGDNRKLMVDCTGEGAVFVEADADVALDDFGEELYPPFPCLEELLPEMEGSNGILNSPLLYLQVTRLKCGSFILGIRFSHVMSDGIGMTLFLKTLAELGRGANAPSVPPVWERHLLTARVPPHVTHPHPEYDNAPPGPDDILPPDQQFQRSFFFGPTEISTLRAFAPADIRDSVLDLELITAVLWRCRTIALSPNPKAETRVMSVMEVHFRLNNPPLPQGYYGNTIALPVAVATAEYISKQPLESAIRLVHEASANITDEYVRSMVDLLAMRGRPPIALARTYLMVDVWLFGLDEVDFGWGKPLFCGPPTAGLGEFYGVSYFVPYRNKEGVAGTLVPVILPEAAMEPFAEELARVLANK